MELVVPTTRPFILVGAIVRFKAGAAITDQLTSSVVVILLQVTLNTKKPLLIVVGVPLIIGSIPLPPLINCNPDGKDPDVIV